VLSKVIELMMFPILYRFAVEQGFTVTLASHQNHYPDLTLTAADGTRFAIDIKTTYRTGVATINGMTLGTYTGYFRNRTGTKNITFPYNSYSAHLVLGIIYTRTSAIDEQRVYGLEQLEQIPSVSRDFEFFIQEKYRIASDRPGSGNTSNIGSVVDYTALINGQGLFALLDEAIFDDYWMFYMTRSMAQGQPAYTNLTQYRAYKGLS
jgi:hypothetical protein